MNKILTISIPTHNRPDSLATLISDLLNADLMDLVEINVHDNSDKSIQDLNKLSCAEVNYFPNISNIGYGGNIRSCIKQATGQYLYIISDDDIYDFSAIGNVLQLLERKKCDALVLTCSLSTDISIKFNTLHNSLNCNLAKLGDVLDSTEVVTPLNLLPSFIAETALMKRGERLFNKGGNDYMHSMIFLMGAACDTKVMFDSSGFIVTYNIPESSSSQFGLSNLLNSKEEITKILREKFNVRSRLGLEILEVSKWCFMSDINAPKVQLGFLQVLSFSVKSLRVLKLAPLIFFWLALLPNPIRYKLYQLGLRLKAAW